MTDEEISKRLGDVKTFVNWIEFNNASEKVRYTWSTAAADTLQSIAEEMMRRIGGPKS